MVVCAFEPSCTVVEVTRPSESYVWSVEDTGPPLPLTVVLSTKSSGLNA